MKVLFISNIPSPNKIDFLNELGKLCDLTAVFELTRATDRNIDWISDEARYFKAIQLHGLKLKSDQALCIDIRKYLKCKFDHIIVAGYSTPTGMYAITFLKRHRIPFWISVDGGIIGNDSRLKYWLKYKLISSATYWFSSGKTVDAYLEYYGAKKERISWVPFTSLKQADVLNESNNQQEKKNMRSVLHLDLDRPIILSVGQFIYRKGFDVLIKAMSQCSSKYQLLIIGDEPTEEYLELRAAYNLENISFCGFMNKEKLRMYYQAADLFVLPTREDIWGLVINEAMAMGLPVITTDKCVAGLELVTNDLNGYIVPCEDIEALSKRISKIMEGEDLRNRMSINSLRKIEEYTVENMAYMYMNGMKKYL